MYLNYFNFKKSPFHITPDPEFLFQSQSHREASASIYVGVEHRKGLVAISGEVGVGKTTVVRAYLEGTDPEKIKIVYIFNPVLSFEKLVKQIISELGIPDWGKDLRRNINALFQYLTEEYKNDRNVALIVDEAQNMPVETLERLRMLLNLKVSQDNLLQIVLVGQPEFEDKLNLPELKQLKELIAIHTRIETLTPDEGLAYIQHRLMIASSFYNPVFAEPALKRIVKEAKGVPRVINILCDNALLTAYGYDRKPVDVRIIKEVIKDLRGELYESSFSWRIGWVPAMVASIALVVVASVSLLRPKEIPHARTEILGTRVSALPLEHELVKEAQARPFDESEPEVEPELSAPESKTGSDDKSAGIGPSNPVASEIQGKTRAPVSESRDPYSRQ